MQPIQHLKCFQYLLLVIALLAMAKTRSQIEDIPISKEVNIDMFYAGLLTDTGILNDRVSYGDFSSLQFGARVSFWLVPETLRIRTFGAIKTTAGQDTKYLKSYEAIFAPNKSIAFHIGTMATPTTTLRPNPITWQSQVETNAESTIPGGKPGIKIRYNLNKDLSFTYGIHKHAKKGVQHLKISYKQLSFSSYFEDNRLFVAAKWQYENGHLVVTAFDNNMALSSIVPFSDYYRFYVDMEYNNSDNHLTFGAWGLRRHFSDSNLIRGFLSLTYNSKFKGFYGGLFIHI